MAMRRFLRDQNSCETPSMVSDDQTLLAFCVLAERHGTGDLWLSMPASPGERAEQFGNARQTAGDVRSSTFQGIRASMSPGALPDRPSPG